MNFFEKLSDWYFNRRSLPYWGVFVTDLLLVYCSYWLTYLLFRPAVLTSWWHIEAVRAVMPSFFGWLGLRIFVFTLWYVIGMRLFHTYSGIIRYSSFVDLLRITGAMFLSGFLAWLFHYYSFGIFPFEFPGGMVYFEANIRTRDIFVATLMATAIIGFLRIVVKIFYDVTFQNSEVQRSIIYGTRADGLALAKAIAIEKPKKFKVCFFATDNVKMANHHLLGKKIWLIGTDGLVEELQRKHITAFLVAPENNLNFQNNRELQQALIDAGIKIFMMPSAQRWEEGFQAQQMREIRIEDLLSRREIQVNLEDVRQLLRAQCVCVTGSAGSIGGEIVRQVASFGPKRLVLIDQAETPQHDIRLMLAKDFPEIEAHTIVCNICHEKRMDYIFQKYRPDYVFHAAAYKHVPMMENNPCEAILNNVVGTQVIADLSVKYGVKKFVMISTDKAVNPTNVMGCSKRICEIYAQSLDRAIAEGQVQGKTRFVTTRFGNVLGSNGSVIPIFKRQIEEGGPVTVTHPDIIRYFMLISEAVKLVLEAATHGEGGEIFVFDMGKPVKIVDLARNMIKLSGKPEVQIEFTGLRDGEKLYEEVLDLNETTQPSFHPRIHIAIVRECSYADFSKDLAELYRVALAYDDMEVVRKMKEMVPEYVSNHSVYEKLDHQ